MTNTTPETTWFIPATTVHLPDGSTLVKPGKAIQRATLKATVKMTGVPRRVLNALAECGLITRERPCLRTAFFYPGEIMDFLRKTAEDPNHWDAVKTQAYLTGKDLRNSKPK